MRPMKRSSIQHAKLNIPHRLSCAPPLSDLKFHRFVLELDLSPQTGMKVDGFTHVLREFKRGEYVSNRYLRNKHRRGSSHLLLYYVLLQ